MKHANEQNLCGNLFQTPNRLFISCSHETEHKVSNKKEDANRIIITGVMNKKQ